MSRIGHTADWHGSLLLLAGLASLMFDVRGYVTVTRQ